VSCLEAMPGRVWLRRCVGLRREPRCHRALPLSEFGFFIDKISVIKPHRHWGRARDEVWTHKVKRTETGRENDLSKTHLVPMSNKCAESPGCGLGSVTVDSS
jgi:hypothetical protein